MRYSFAFIAAMAATVQAHGVITEVQGANGVTMPGLSVQDGTPRDCASPGCGSEADTSIIRTREMGGKASALGRTQGGGAVDAAAAISQFMGTGAAAAGATTAGATTAGTAKTAATQKRGLLDALTGGKAGGAAKAGGADAAGTKTPKGTAEQGVSKAAGSGASSGLPTTSDDGSITMTFHQVNQDGAGPLTAQIDATSGGTDPAAFQDAQVTQNVPGIGIGGLSGATTMDFPVKVQMPAGMTCQGTAGGASNVCIVRMQNSALAGPFGGSAAFTQSTAAKKRAVEYNLRKRHMARGVLGKLEE
ncbi:Nn.00g001640.m01.CDS01 [Neocucurbitaria sp. VM-36]